MHCLAVTSPHLHALQPADQHCSIAASPYQAPDAESNSNLAAKHLASLHALALLGLRVRSSRPGR